MKRVGVVLLIAVSACSETAEMKAWNARKAELSVAISKLRALDSDRASAQSKLDAAQPEWVAVQSKLDLVAAARAVDAGLRALQDERGTSLAFDGSLEACRDALTALGDARKLVNGWKLRIDPDGTCRWQALETPSVHSFHLGDAPARWVPPPSELTSRGVSALRAEVKDLEAERAKLESALAGLAVVPTLEARLASGKDVLDAVTRSPPPCDLAVVTRALELNKRGLLEISAGSFVHPLAPEDDPRTRGLATRLPDGPLIWSCEP